MSMGGGSCITVLSVHISFLSAMAYNSYLQGRKTWNLNHISGGFMKKGLFLITLLLVFSSAVFCYQLSPLSATYDPTGAGSARVYTITNDSDSPIAIEINAYSRNIDLDGNEYTEDASAYFQIQPRRMIIRPQSSQLVRVQYRGPQTVTREMAYRIISEQIPYSVGASEEESGQMISFLFVYSTSAYVRPTRVVERVESSASANEEGKLEIRLENTGSVHQMLNSLSVTVRGDDGSEYVLSDEEMGAISGQNLLAGSTLRIVIDMPEVLSGASSYGVEVEYDYSYSA